MALFGKKKKTAAAKYDGPPIDVEWVRNRNGKFHRLIHLDTLVEGLSGIGGVYVIWHSGVKPKWVYIDKAADLAGAIDAALDNNEIMDYEKHGGLFVTWSPIKPEFRGGVLRYLHDNMDPEVPNPDAKNLKDDPIKVLEPKRRDKPPSTDTKTIEPSSTT